MRGICQLYLLEFTVGGKNVKNYSTCLISRN